MTLNTDAGKSYKHLWLQRYARDKEGYAEVLSWDPFKNWEKSSLPEEAVQGELTSAFELRCAGLSGREPQAFLERAITIADRAIREGKLRQGRCVDGWPLNLGVLLRARAYAIALSGLGFDAVQVTEAAKHISDWISQGDEWNAQVQADALGAARLYLLGNLPDAAEAVLQNREFKWHGAEASILNRLARGAQQPFRLKDDMLAADLETYFDLVRDPRFRSDVYMERACILPLELAALRERYFVSSDGSIDWNRVIEAVSR